MAKKKKTESKKTESKKSEPKPRAPDPRVDAARKAYAVGNYSAVRKLHEEAEGLDKQDAALLEELFQKTLTDKTPWLVAAGALVVTVIAGLLTLS